MHAREFRAMGTDVRVLVASTRATGAAREVEGLFAEWESALSRFRAESDLCALNARAGRPVEVGEILLEAAGAAVAAARETNGLFDPTLELELVRIGYDRSFEQVCEVAPSTRRPRRGGSWRRVRIDRAHGTVTLPAGCGLDLGGIAKGMAVDAALGRLLALGFDSALVSAGGDLAVRGLPPGSEPWRIRVSPEDDAQVVQLLRGALATSGTTGRAWRQGAVAHHHVLDPRTGQPSRSGLRRVTVAASTCRAAEAAATAALVAGPALGARLLERAGLVGLFVTESGRRLTVGRWPQVDLRAA
jgi:thiamine biosynthesis lipoprotein